MKNHTDAQMCTSNSGKHSQKIPKTTHNRVEGVTEQTINKGPGQTLSDGPGHVSETDVKYNVRPQDNYDFSPFGKLLINIDWFSFRIADTLEIEDFKDGILQKGIYQFELQEDYSTPQFNNVAKIFYNNMCLGTIQFGARTGINAMEGKAIIKLENWVFYGVNNDVYDRPTLWKYCTDHLIACLESTFINITQLDICVDGINLNSFFTDFWYNEKFEAIKRETLPITPSNPIKGKLEFESFTIGHHGSKATNKKRGQRFARYYNKSKEISIHNGKKDYILDYFINNGLEGENINRFEISLRSELLKTIELDVNTLYKKDVLVSLFDKYLKNFFEFVPSDSTDTKRSRRERIQIFDFGKFKEVVFARIKRTVKNTVRTAKIMVKQLIRTAYHTKKSSDTLLESAYTIMEQNKLFQWLYHSSPKITDELLKEAKHSCIHLMPFGHGDNIAIHLRQKFFTL